LIHPGFYTDEIFLLSLKILNPFWGASQEYYRSDKYCNKYSDWFGNGTIKWNKEDSLAAFEYNKN
jgi:hypothetical protein